jgi:hypothetical protein
MIESTAGHFAELRDFITMEFVLLQFAFHPSLLTFLDRVLDIRGDPWLITGMELDRAHRKTGITGTKDDRLEYIQLIFA